MSEQEIPFEESATMAEMEYAAGEQEKSLFFPEYRNDGKLIPHQRPHRGNLPLVLIPVVFILAFLLFSYVAGYAFYAHSSFGPGQQNEYFYNQGHFDHHRFPQQQFDQPNQSNQPNQPIQGGQAGQPAPVIPAGTMPRMIDHHSAG